MRPIPIDFHIGPLVLHTYGFGLGITFWFAYWYLGRRFHHYGLSTKWLEKSFIWIIVMAVVGARIVHCIANIGYYLAHPILVFAVWQGGLSSYGGIAGGLIVALYTLHKYNPEISFRTAADVTAPVGATNDEQALEAEGTGDGGETTPPGEIAAVMPPADPITDSLTGLMNEVFFSGLLSTKVATARRRLWPLSVVLLQLTIVPEVSEEAIDAGILAFSEAVRATIRTADVACRVGPKSFALLLDDTDEDGAAWVAERIQIAHARQGDSPVAKVFAGVASYPSHGIEPAEILVTAKSALKQASDHLELPGLGRVIVAPQRPL
jgi:diguanylate cyclase (GGDEF)-like protein